MKWILLVGMLCAFLLMVSCTEAPQLVLESDTVVSEDSAVIAAPGTTYDVVIENGQFMPVSLEIKAGNQVTWTNTDDSEHTVTFDNGIVDEKLPMGGTVSYTFTEKGEFSYSCLIHSNMQGTIMVE